MREIGDVLLYNSCPLPIQVMTTGPLPAPSKCKSGLPQITGTCPGWWKQSFQLRLWYLVWFQVRATSCHLTSSKSAWKSNQNVPDVLKSVVIPWCNQVADPGCGNSDTSPKRSRLGFRRSATTLYHSLTGPPTWTCWTTSFDHTSRTSPTWPPTTPKLAWSPPSLEYSPSSGWCWWKRHASSSGSVSRRWLRLKAATLNRCQLYNIIKLAELIFSIKVLK